MSVMYCHTFVSPGIGAVLHTWRGDSVSAQDCVLWLQGHRLKAGLLRSIHVSAYHISVHMLCCCRQKERCSSRHLAQPQEMHLDALATRGKWRTFLVRRVLMTEDLPTLGYPTNPTLMYFLSERSRDSCT